jgi:squalene cyclase
MPQRERSYLYRPSSFCQLVTAVKNGGGACDGSGVMSRAATFLLNRQANDGVWRDFRTLAGEAEDWTTAYVAWQLSTAGVAAPSFRRAKDALFARQRADGGWGYNSLVPSDIDSTAWALLFLAQCTRHCRVLSDGVRYLVARQDADTGGVGTYADPVPILRYMRLPVSTSLAGWSQPLVEVTALAGRALAAVKDSPPEAIRAAWRFVREHQGQDGQWRSYWWTTPLYATLHAVAFARSRHGLPGARNVVRHAVLGVIETQGVDGGWAAGCRATARAFDTALAVAIISCGAPSPLSRAVLERAIDCLRGMQLASGQWPTAPILRIPPPSIINPDRFRRWRTNELGTGVILSDPHGVFTTATVVAALALGRRALAVR